MKNLQENINRIKELMLVENDDQLSLFSGDEGKPININSDEFTKRFKEKVYFILKDLYKSNWSSDRSRGPGGGGGVVGVHTVYDLLKEKGLTDYDPEGGDWSILNYFDTKYWLPEESNFKLDRSTMLNSVEGRVPFQDIDLLKNIYPILYNEKFSLFYDKKIIRNNFKNIPSFILNRKKHGWFSPDNYYLKNSLKDFFLETFNKTKLDKQNIFNYGSVIRLFKNHISDTSYNKSELVTLLAFQSWYDQVLKS